ncbi:MAG: polyprenyl synthetase family protein [Lachnospiraceae bacterium]|nr:polyprenyl synthetase family protein [Lachnospiraceae bacterium]
MNFEAELKERTGQVEQVLKQFLLPETGYQKTIFEAVNYSMTAGGKRLRPLFLVECNRMLGGNGCKDPLVCAFAAALEMIHTYSLVHDDLPAMDNDEYRRGKLTTHAKYGEAMGILAGDALLNHAFEITAAALVQETAPERLCAGAQALKVLAEKAGMFGMLGGQVVDVEKTGQPMDAEEMDFVYRLKTGALLEAAMMIGGILAGVKSTQVEVLQKAATAVGMAFQIQDDILDVTSSLEVLGKPVHSDEKNAKTTYVTAHSMEQAQAQVKVLSEQAVGYIEQMPGEKEFVKALVLSLIERSY